MKYSILMPLYIQHELQFRITKACIDNIMGFTSPDWFELIVLHSNAKDWEKVKPFLREQDTYIPFDNNPSQAEALNIGIKKAKGDYITLIGNDNFVHQDWLEEIDKRLGNEKFPVLGCTVDRQPYEDYKKYMEDNPDGIRPSKFSYLNFQGVTIPKWVFDKIGLLDENLPFYLWEMDLNERFAKEGIEVAGVLTSYMTTPQSMTRYYTRNEKTIDGQEDWWSDEAHHQELIYFREKYPS